MKKFLIVLVSILVCFASSGQVIRTNTMPGFQPIGGTTTLTRINGVMYPVLAYVPALYVDTTDANNNPYVKNFPLAQIGTTSDGKYWMRNYACTKWVEVGSGGGGGGSGNNLYNIDSLLASNRTVGMNGKTLNFRQDAENYFKLYGNSAFYLFHSPNRATEFNIDGSSFYTNSHDSVLNKETNIIADGDVISLQAHRFGYITYSDITVLDSMIQINAHKGNVVMDTLNYTLSTIRKKLLLRDTLTGLLQDIDPALINTDSLFGKQDNIADVNRDFNFNTHEFRFHGDLSDTLRIDSIPIKQFAASTNIGYRPSITQEYFDPTNNNTFRMYRSPWWETFTHIGDNYDSYGGGGGAGYGWSFYQRDTLLHVIGLHHRSNDTHFFLGDLVDPNGAPGIAPNTLTTIEYHGLPFFSAFVPLAGHPKILLGRYPSWLITNWDSKYGFINGEAAAFADTVFMKSFVSVGATTIDSLVTVTGSESIAGGLRVDKDIRVAGVRIGTGHNASTTGSPVGLSVAIGQNVFSNGVNYKDEVVAIGNDAMQGSGNGYQSTAVGFRAAYSGNGWFDVAIGKESLANWVTTNNFGFDGHVAVGGRALYWNTGGGSLGLNNTAVGTGAGYNITTGGYNVAMGTLAMGSGWISGSTGNTGSYNIGIGVLALYNNKTGSAQIGVGYNALLNSNPTTGYNIAIGHQAGSALTTGDYNVIIGGHGGFATKSKWLVLADGQGNVKLVADSVGNVGIGTLAPDSLLTVSGGGLYTDRGVRHTNLPTTAQARLAMIGVDGTMYSVDTTGLFGGGGAGSSPAGNFGNLQINRNGVFATPGSDSLDWESATGLSIKGRALITDSLAIGANGNYLGTSTIPLSIYSSESGAYEKYISLRNDAITSSTVTRSLGIAFNLSTDAVGEIDKSAKITLYSGSSYANDPSLYFNIGAIQPMYLNGVTGVNTVGRTQLATTSGGVMIGSSAASDSLLQVNLGLHIGRGIKAENLPDFADTTNFKQVVVNVTGVAGTIGTFYKTTYWPVGSGGGTPAGNYGNVQLNRNGAFATPGSDSLDFESATGLTVKGDIRTANSFITANSTADGAQLMVGDGARTTLGGTAQATLVKILTSASPLSNLLHMDNNTSTARAGFILSNSASGGDWANNHMGMLVNGATFGSNYYLTNIPGKTSDASYSYLFNQGSSTAALGVMTVANTPLYFGSNNLAQMLVFSTNVNMLQPLYLGDLSTVATALLQMKAGTAAASTAPLKFTSGTNLTTAEAGAVEYNGEFYATKVNAVRFGVGGALKTNTTDVGNVGAGVDDLMTYSIPAGTLSADGDYLEFTMTFTFAANANSKQVQVIYGGTTIYASGAQLQNDGMMQVKGTIIRTGAATQKITFNENNNTTLFVDTAVYTTAAETLSGAVTLKATGEAVSNNDIVQKILTVKYFPAN